MAKIIPAILETDREKFADKVYQLRRLSGIETIQVDFCDGRFVETQTLQAKDLEPLNPIFTWEAHVMANEPKDFLDYKLSGFSKIIVHYEAFSSETALENALASIVGLGLTPAIAINPETPVSTLKYHTDTIKNFTLLSVHPGKQGNPFLVETPTRLYELRKLSPDAILEVDGGISAETAGLLAQNGADQLVVGSALFSGNRLQENFDVLVQAASKPA